MLGIRLLGRFSVTWDGEPVADSAWRLRKARSLVKLTALAPGARVHREEILDRLWPDRGAAAAVNNFHQALYAARRALSCAGADGASALVLHDDVLALAGAGIDAVDFERAAEAALPAGNVTTLRAAADLYTGELLPEDRYEEWTVERRQALHELHLQLLVALAAAERRADPEAAARTLRRAIAADPLHEPAHRALMRLHAENGRRQAALEQFQRLRQALRRQYEDEPDPQTRMLYRELLSGTATAEPAPTPEPGPRSRPRANPNNLPVALTSFVGRAREQEQLRRLLAAGRTVTLTGVGGCGKTRLALEAAAAALPEYPGGVWFVELAPLTDGSLVGPELANVVGAAPAPGHSHLDAAVEALGEARALVLLDNCEHVIEAAAEAAHALNTGCRAVKVLCTSREALQVPGELAWHVPPLSIAEAVLLFRGRAAAAAPGVVLDADADLDIEVLCRRLEGIPLAVELAAARPVLPHGRAGPAEEAEGRVRPRKPLPPEPEHPAQLAG